MLEKTENGCFSDLFEFQVGKYVSLRVVANRVKLLIK